MSYYTRKWPHGNRVAIVEIALSKLTITSAQQGT